MNCLLNQSLELRFTRSALFIQKRKSFTVPNDPTSKDQENERYQIVKQGIFYIKYSFSGFIHCVANPRMSPANYYEDQV